MVGKWTNEPCSGVDEAVNHFWVLTRLRSKRKSKFVHHPRSCDAIRVSPIAESARKREIALAERISWLIRVKRAEDVTEPG